MVKGLVSNIERGSTLDGPGIRTVVFLKGCPLSCVWCHNPETMMPVRQPVWDSRLCAECGRCMAACPVQTLEVTGGGIRFPRDGCRTCAMPCVAACPNGALEVCGRWMAVEEVVDQVTRDKMFYAESGGGVTFSGGEPLAQPEFVMQLARFARENGIHTALDTSGYASWQALATLLPWIDLVLYDLKVLDPRRHQELTGVPLEGILKNLRRVDATGCAIWIRRPVVPGVNDQADDLEATAAFVATLRNVKRLELLPFNTLAKLKYPKIGRPCGWEDVGAPSRDAMEAFQGIFCSKGVPCYTG